MPPEVYYAVRDQCQEALRGLFKTVTTPIEGPAKTDHGDVDVLVAEERNADTADWHGLLDAIKTALGAEHAIYRPAGTSSHFVVPWPTDISDIPTSSPVDRQRYIQVDVRICTTTTYLRWVEFRHAHGDLWSTLGYSLRPVGLTADDEALWLRVPEIEASERLRARIRLTDDPAEVLSFLGMDPERYWKGPFDSVADMFEYVASYRWFCVHADDSENGAETRRQDEVDGETVPTLRSRDRRRLLSRPVFCAWLESFLPACRATGRFVRPREGPASHTADDHQYALLLRDHVRDEAFSRFGPEVAADYSARLKDWTLQRQRDDMWRQVIQDGIPDADSLDPQYRGCLISALKKIVLAGDSELGIVPDRPLQDDGIYDIDLVMEFVQSKWELVGKAAWERQLARARENMTRKAQAGAKK
jgi:hypothetical protein